MAHLSILAWKVPWTEEPAAVHGLGSQSRTHTPQSCQGRLIYQILGLAYMKEIGFSDGSHLKQLFNEIFIGGHCNIYREPVLTRVNQFR